MTAKSRLQPDGGDAALLQAAQQAFPGEAPKVIGVAVSGGSDSMALLHLFAGLQAHRGGTVRAVTLDHRLRPEAAEEARFVADFCASQGVEHDTLVWEHGTINGNLQNQARRARYRLIGDWAQEHGIGHVVVGHTADDQAETVLMGLARAAGIDGLAGMRKCWEQHGVAWSRPLLLRTRAELRDYLKRHAISWLDDPSNKDERFTRVKARKVLEALKPLGITAETLSAVAGNIASGRCALQIATAEAAQRSVTEDAGELVLRRHDFLLLVPELRRRLLVSALEWISGADYPPRADALFRFASAIKAGRDATLSGCRVRVTEQEARISREPRAVAGLEGPSDALWDGRWRLSGPHEAGLTVRALGADGLRLCKGWRATGHSRAALIVSPAVWGGETLVAAPLAGMEHGWTAEIVRSFHSFLISH